MAKLSKSDAAKTIGVARQTLYTYIKEGRISADPDGLIDTSELIRAGFELRLLDSHEGVTIRHDMTGGNGQNDPENPVHETAQSTKILELYEKQIKLLEQELTAAKEREMRLLGIVEQTQKQLFLPPPPQLQQGSVWSRLFSRKGTKPT